MARLLVNAPSGNQELIVVYEGGDYFDQSRVLWNELKHGPLPAAVPPQVGGWVVDVDSPRKLKFDAAKYDAQKQVELQTATAQAAQAQAVIDAQAKIKTVDWDAIKSIDDLKDVVKALCLK